MPNRLNIRIVGPDGPYKQNVVNLIKPILLDSGYKLKQTYHNNDIVLIIKPPK